MDQIVDKIENLTQSEASLLVEETCDLRLGYDGESGIPPNDLVIGRARLIVEVCYMGDFARPYEIDACATGGIIIWFDLTKCQMSIILNNSGSVMIRRHYTNSTETNCVDIRNNNDMKQKVELELAA